MSNNQVVNQQTPETLRALMPQHFPHGILPFKPCAFYLEALDRVYVMCKDRSPCEMPINASLTLIEDLHSRDSRPHRKLIGFMVEPAVLLCDHHGILPDTEGRVNIHKILDQIALEYPTHLDEIYSAREMLYRLDRPLVKIY